MKTTLLFLLFLTLQGYSQKAKHSDSLSVLFNAPNSSQAITNQILSVSKTMMGVSFRGYCSSHDVFSVKIATDVYQNQSVFVSELKNITGIDVINLKTGIEEDIFPYCGEYPNYWAEKDKASKK